MAKVTIPVELTPVNARKVEASLAQLKAKAKGVNLGGGAESISKLSRPLGKITGQASEFQKSLEASNARVLAFGASVAVINKLSQAFGALISNTIKVEATFAKINTILGGSQKQLEQFGNGIFKVAQQTGTSFDQVAEGALELARQGLSVEESLGRVEVALKLVRVAGIDSEKAVAGLTAAIKGFEGAGLSVAQVADKLSEVDTKFAVSTEDLINGLERASASARVAGVSFDELLGVITTVQERTQRGGAVIGNAFKTIFARLGRTDTLLELQQLGISVVDTEGNVRDAIPIFKDLAKELNSLGLRSEEAGDIIQKVAGVRQRDILINLVEDLNSSQSQFAKTLEVSAGAAGALDAKNTKLNDTLEALINNLTVGGQKLASVLGELGFTDAAKDIIKTFSTVVNVITDTLQGDSIGAKFAQGLVKGVGSVLTGPGLGLVGAIFIKLFVDLAKFGSRSLKDLLGINKAAQQQSVLQQSIFQTLLQNESVQLQLLKHEGNRVVQEQILLKLYNEQAAALARVQKVAATVTPALFNAGLRGGESGVRPTGGRSGRGANGYISDESRDVSRGVGGAPSSAKVVSIPNFAFGGGKRGTMFANTSEYVVPNYAGGGDAIFNQDMVKTMGLPAGAKKLNAAGGFIPNFANKNVSKFGFLVPQVGLKRPIKPLENVSIAGKKTTLTGITARGIVPGQAESISDPIENRIRKSVINESAAYAKELKPLGRTVSKAEIESGFGTIAGAKGALQAAIGSAFEVAITKALDYKSAIREKGGDFDIRGGVNLSRIQKLFGLPKTTNIADLKVSDSPGNVESFYSKILKEINASRFGETEKRKNARKIATQQAISKYPESFTNKGDLRRDINPSERDRLNKLINRTSKTVFRGRFGNASAADGYIPNFAGGALEEAISREKAAGLPINQIRINQSGKLRNAKNPMGLAVTNTRDEPTGAIPNFAKPPGGDGPNSAFDSTITKLFALQLVVGGLTNSLVEQEGAMSKLSDAVSSAVNTLITLSVIGAKPLGGISLKGGVGKGFGAFFKSVKGAGGALAKLRLLAGPVALGFTAIDAALKIFLGKGVISLVGDGLVKLGFVLSEETKRAQKGLREFTESIAGKDLKDASSTLREQARRQQREKKVEAQVKASAPFIASESEIGIQGAGLKGTSIFSRSRGDKPKFDVGEDIISSISEIYGRDFSVEAIKKQFEVVDEKAIEAFLKVFNKNREGFEAALNKAGLAGDKDAATVAAQSLKIYFEDFLNNLAEAEQKVLEQKRKKFEAQIKSGTLLSSERSSGILERAGSAKKASIESSFTNETSRARSDLALGNFSTQTEKTAIEDSLRVAEKQKTIDLARLEVSKQIKNEVLEQITSNNQLTGITKEQFQQSVASLSLVDLEGKTREELLQKAKDLGIESTAEQENFAQAALLGSEKLKAQESLLNSIYTTDKLIAETEAGRVDKLTEINRAAELRISLAKKESEISKISTDKDISLKNIQLSDPTAFLGAQETRDIEYEIKSLEIQQRKREIADQIRQSSEALADLEQQILESSDEQKVTLEEQKVLLQDAHDILLMNKEATDEIAAAQDKVNKKIQKQPSFVDGLREGKQTLDNTADTFLNDIGKEAPQRLADGLGTAMSEALSGAKDIGDALADAGKSFLQYMVDAFLQQAAMQAVSGVMGAFGPSVAVAKGGFITEPRPIGFESGGSVGHTPRLAPMSSTDTVPAMLTPGEFVIKKSSVEQYGTSFLSSLNEGLLPMSKFQNGGSVSAISTSPQAGPANQITNSSDFTFNIEGGKGEKGDSSVESENGGDFARRIRSAVTNIVQEESRRGGSLGYLYK